MKMKNILLAMCICCSISTSSFANLKIGTLFFYPPFIITLNEGFDVQLIQLLCKGLNQTCDMYQMDLSQLYKGLNSGTIDMAIGGIAIPLSPDPTYIYSLPYMLSQGQFMVLNTDAIKSTNDLNGSTVGVIAGREGGGPFYDYLQSTYVGKFQIKMFDDVEDLVTALNNKSISAAFFHSPSVNYWIQNSSSQFKTLGEGLTIGDGLGIISMPKNKLLMEQINQLLQKLATESVYLDLYNNYLEKD